MTNTDTVQTEFLTFQVSGSCFAIAITDVLEIKTWQEPTVLPGSANSHLGVINLRGHVVPVLDLAKVLDLHDTANENRALIVVSVSGGHVGLAVDSVTDILDAENQNVCAVPILNGQDHEPLVSHLISQDTEMVRVIDLKNLTPASLVA